MDKRDTGTNEEKLGAWLRQAAQDWPEGLCLFVANAGTFTFGPPAEENRHDDEHSAQPRSGAGGRGLSVQLLNGVMGGVGPKL